MGANQCCSTEEYTEKETAVTGVEAFAFDYEGTEPRVKSHSEDPPGIDFPAEDAELLPLLAVVTETIGHLPQCSSEKYLHWFCALWKRYAERQSSSDSLLDTRISLAGVKLFVRDMMSQGWDWEELRAEEEEKVFEHFAADGGMPFRAFVAWSEDDQFDAAKWIECRKQSKLVRDYQAKMWDEQGVMVV